MRLTLPWKTCMNTTFKQSSAVSYWWNIELSTWVVKQDLI